MSRSIVKLSVVLFASLFSVLACTEQHDPRGHWKQFEGERKIAHAAKPELSDDGTLPGTSAAPKIDIAAKYATYCTMCHGAEGKGDGAAAGGMPVKARNFVDKAWQASVTDEHLSTVIAKGGAAVGLNASMPPAAGLSSEEIALMVGYIRKLGN